MQKLSKISALACCLVTLAYFIVPAPVGGREAAAQALVKFPFPSLPLAPCPGAQEHSLPLPSGLPPAQFVDFEKQVFSFLQSGEYKRLGWCMDKGVRDTGAFSQGVYYGTHPAVRVFYSPKAMQWLAGGRQGPIPDGALIIKEQYPPPAGRYAGLVDNQLPKVTDWTIMIKDSKGSKDGWFWGEFWEKMKFDDDSLPFDYPWASFGLYCLRCHATAEKEYTFASLDNVRDFPGRHSRSPTTARGGVRHPKLSSTAGGSSPYCTGILSGVVPSSPLPMRMAHDPDSRRYQEHVCPDRSPSIDSELQRLSSAGIGFRDQCLSTH